MQTRQKEKTKKTRTVQQTKTLTGSVQQRESIPKTKSLQEEIVDLFTEDDQTFQAIDKICSARNQIPNQIVIDMANFLGIPVEPKSTLCVRVQNDIDAPGFVVILRDALGAFFHKLYSMISVNSLISHMRRTVKSLLVLPVVVNASSPNPPEQRKLNDNPRLYAQMAIDIAPLRKYLADLQTIMHAVLSGTTFSKDIFYYGRWPRLSPRLFTKPFPSSHHDLTKIEPVVAKLLTALNNLQSEISKNKNVNQAIRDIKEEQARMAEERARKRQEILMVQQQIEARRNADRQYGQQERLNKSLLMNLNRP